MDAHWYNVEINWENDRKGKMSSPELSQTVEVATPPQFPKGMENIWSPEHLFTAAVSSCLMTTFLAISENSRLEYSKLEIKSKGKLEQVEGKFLMTEVILEPYLVIKKEEDRAKAEKVLEKSESNCLISNSIKSKVTMLPKISIESC